MFRAYLAYLPGGHDDSQQPAAELSWLIRVTWLIRCTIDPLINHKALINHVNVMIVVLMSEYGLMGLA